MSKSMGWVVAVIYLLSPVDFAPEALLGPFGLADDVLVLIWAAVREGAAAAEQEVVRRRGRKPQAAGEKPEVRRVARAMPYRPATPALPACDVAAVAADAVAERFREVLPAVDLEKLRLVVQSDVARAVNRG